METITSYLFLYVVFTSNKCGGRQRKQGSSLYFEWMASSILDKAATLFIEKIQFESDHKVDKIKIIKLTKRPRAELNGRSTNY